MKLPPINAIVTFDYLVGNEREHHKLQAQIRAVHQILELNM